MRAAITYHYFAVYREALLRALMQQEDPQYTLISGRRSNLPGLRTLDPALADRPISEGGLRWSFVRNLWLKKIALWQSGHIRLALSSEYDTIIYLGDWRFISTWISALLARFRGKRVLMWTHGLRSRSHGLLGRVRMAFYRLAHGLLLYGHHARRLLMEEGFDPDALYVIYNSLDYDAQKALRDRLPSREIAETRASLFADASAPVLTFIGRLIDSKRLDMLVEAVARLRDCGKPVNVLLIGEGPAQPKLQAEVDKARLTDRVVFYGPCFDETQLARLMLSADLCVCPEAVGLTVMHALAYGLPVITSDGVARHGPEFEAIVPDVSGQFFRQGDVDDLARCIEGWLARPTSREETAAACIRIVEKYYNAAVQVQIINKAVRGVPATECIGDCPGPLL